MARKPVDGKSIPGPPEDKALKLTPRQSKPTGGFPGHACSDPCKEKKKEPDNDNASGEPR